MVREVLRTCKGCGCKTVKQELDRYVFRKGVVVKDVRSTMGGRGAYCCRNDKCSLRFLDDEKRWTRAFRCKL